MSVGPGDGSFNPSSVGVSGIDPFYGQPTGHNTNVFPGPPAPANPNTAFEPDPITPDKLANPGPGSSNLRPSGDLSMRASVPRELLGTGSNEEIGGITGRTNANPDYNTLTPAALMIAQQTLQTLTSGGVVTRTGVTTDKLAAFDYLKATLTAFAPAHIAAAMGLDIAELDRLHATQPGDHGQTGQPLVANTQPVPTINIETLRSGSVDPAQIPSFNQLSESVQEIVREKLSMIDGRTPYPEKRQDQMQLLSPDEHAAIAFFNNKAQVTQETVSKVFGVSQSTIWRSLTTRGIPSSLVSSFTLDKKKK
ncbi:hypothetical protein LMG27198_26360 [Methylocystis echinoides]|uniref:Uncharacterized protein n=2 Tax=Methylocystis echinoides TaxID=29468 RepID=A0A9W6GV79_9HYPH|nr:hypothetical protein LMG27198_26360 [Methylocystis echinoides]